MPGQPLLHVEDEQVFCYDGVHEFGWQVQYSQPCHDHELSDHQMPGLVGGGFDCFLLDSCCSL